MEKIKIILGDASKSIITTTKMTLLMTDLG